MNAALKLNSVGWVHALSTGSCAISSKQPETMLTGPPCSCAKPLALAFSAAMPAITLLPSTPAPTPNASNLPVSAAADLADALLSGWLTIVAKTSSNHILSVNVVEIATAENACLVHQHMHVHMLIHMYMYIAKTCDDMSRGYL